MPVRGAEVVRHLEEDVLPWASRQPGFVSDQWLRAIDGEHGMGMVLFASEEAARDAAEGPRSQPNVVGRAWNIESIELFGLVAAAQG
jgi:hypothetical protein